MTTATRQSPKTKAALAGQLKKAPKPQLPEPEDRELGDYGYKGLALHVRTDGEFSVIISGIINKETTQEKADKVQAEVEEKAQELGLILRCKRFSGRETHCCTSLEYEIPKETQNWEAAYQFAYKAKKLGMTKEQCRELRFKAFDYLQANNVKV